MAMAAIITICKMELNRKRYYPKWKIMCLKTTLTTCSIHFHRLQSGFIRNEPTKKKREKSKSNSFDNKKKNYEERTMIWNLITINNTLRLHNWLIVSSNFQSDLHTIQMKYATQNSVRQSNDQNSSAPNGKNVFCAFALADEQCFCKT